MRTHDLRRSLPTFGIAIALAVVSGAGCSGGGSSSSSSSSDSFRVSSISVQNGGTWQINRAIEVTFSQTVDFSTVNLNTINIRRIGGAPAAGEFSFKVSGEPPVIDTRTVVFQPACPTLDDYSDAGLVPGNVAYSVYVPDGVDGGVSVHSSSGTALAAGQTVNFNTPNSSDPSVVFIDVNPLPPTPLINDSDSMTPIDESKTHLEVGGDTNNRQYFVEPIDEALGADVEDSAFLAPLNLYSDTSSTVAILLKMDQPVDPSSGNINASNVRLEYAECALTTGCDCVDGSGGAITWIPIAHTVTLTENCTANGSTLRLVPTGILPPNRRVRVVLSPQFTDLVGDSNLLDFVVVSFCSGTTPEPFADAYKEEFVIGGTAPGSKEDTESVLPAAPADWGGGELRAGFAFNGQGGPGGEFDWRVRALPGGSSTVFDTTFQLITDETQTGTQAALNGVVDVRNLTIDPGAVLEVRGPNPMVLTASGRITINGRIVIRGTSSRGVFTFNSTTIPEQGAAGNAGGGRGGTGNYLTTQSTPAGENGYGPFDIPGGGGGGGETGYNNSTDPTARRGAGGGGGSLARYVPLSSTPACPDQSIIGLDSEAGGPGATTASGAIGGPGQRPRGGLAGPTAFGDDTVDNDFWGTMIKGTQIIRGELGAPRPGTGGGGGGNCCMTNAFPTTPFSPIGDEKGSGGGGGGGALTLLCLGDIKFGLKGRIDATGGTGGGGENTSGVNRIGGGSGGGSGGHVILQTGARIDFRDCSSSAANLGGIYATGGQGGEGENGLGGAGPNGVPTTPSLDMLPPNSYGTSMGGPSNPPACPVAGNNVGVRIGAGGDGGPGVIQLHVGNLTTDILPPTTSLITLATLMKPNPHGTTAANILSPGVWNRLLPIFGRLSTSQSDWIPLGSANVAPDSSTPQNLEFSFPGLTDGLVTADPVTGMIVELPAILSGDVGHDSGLYPYILDGRTIVFDAGMLADEVYRNNPALLVRFRINFALGSAAVASFEVGSASVNGNDLLLTVSTSGMPLDAIVDGTTASLHPRFFGVSTDGVPNVLPPQATIRIEFQAAPANSFGQPDTSLATSFTSDVAVLNSAPGNANFRFFRFKVTFDIDATGTGSLLDPPIPSLDFLRLPYKF